MATPSKKTTKKDPFKTKQSRSVSVEVSDSIDAPPQLREAIDQFRDAQEQAKHHEAQATALKDSILSFARDLYSQRARSGLPGSFKINGDEAMVTYVVMDKSAGLTEEDLDLIRERWGDKAAEDLVVRDFRSIRFDPQVLEANYDQVVAALQTLPEEVLESLFKPMLMKAVPHAMEKLGKYAADSQQLAELISDLKLTHYIR